MTHITVLGGTGYAGGHIVAEAVSRGHAVISVSRGEPAAPIDGVEYRSIDLLADSGALVDLVENTEVIVEALAPRGPFEGKLRPLVHQLADLVSDFGKRLAVVGGAGSLLAGPTGPRVLDDAAFPAAFYAEGLEMSGILEDLRAVPAPFDWFVLSPAAEFGAANPGERTEKFRVGDDILLADDHGRSTISGADFAIAFVDEIERGDHRRERFTVAY